MDEIARQVGVGTSSIGMAIPPPHLAGDHTGLPQRHPDLFSAKPGPEVDPTQIGFSKKYKGLQKKTNLRKDWRKPKIQMAGLNSEKLGKFSWTKKSFFSKSS